MYSAKKHISNRIIIIPLSLLIFLIFGIISIISSCSKNDISTNTTGGNSGANDVQIKGMAFSPASKTVTSGTTIKWTNLDNVNHTVTSGIPGSPSGLFDSGTIAPNGTFTYTFNQTGTFSYYCKIHTSMTGAITVQAASTGGTGGY